MSIEQVYVDILGRQFTIGTPASERESLLKAVELLNEKIVKIQNSSPAINNEKVAIMAALNLTHDLLKSIDNYQAQALANRGFERRIAALVEQCELAERPKD